MILRKIPYFFLFITLIATGCRKESLPEYDYNTLGTSAHDLLSSSNFSALIVEINYMPGYQVDAAALRNLELFLQDYLNKPGGITITQRQIPASGKPLLTLDEIVGIEKQYRLYFTGGNAIAVHVLIADADYYGSSIFALAYWNTSFCIFGKNTFASSGGSGQVNRTTLLTALLEHEFGHLLGLINQGSPMQTPHKDPANGAHCDNQSCLMYYEIETAASNNVPPFDAYCLADLKANGGR
jgi:hypothetical protein